jgi:RimJ/RimL family protein N-acetyltransferase
MKFVPLDEMTPPLWYHAWNAMFDQDLGDHMGVNPEIIASKPPLEVFYQRVMDSHAEGRFMAWAIVVGDEFKGYTLFDKTFGEWEIGTVLIDPKDWGSGLGARATLKALRWAFEEQDIEWVVAFTQGKDPKVAELLHRGGFRPFLHFHVLDKPTWHARWRARRRE